MATQGEQLTADEATLDVAVPRRRDENPNVPTASACFLILALRSLIGLDENDDLVADIRQHLLLRSLS